MTFAGFWVDGAVRKPKYKDSDCGMVYVKSKDGFDELLDIVCVNDVDVTDDHYWLDTTPRESLTPEELFSLLKVIWPRLEYVDWAANSGWCVASDQTNNETLVQWNGLKTYPPPLEPQWIRITRENVGQYLFRLCRCKDIKAGLWQDGHIVGWDMEDECCLVDSDLDPNERILKFNFVEVQNAPTS